MSGAHIAIQAAAEKRRRQQEEEERMTRYNENEVNEGWEFKIVRSVTSAFKRPEVFRRLVEEEAVAGWELIEKLDDGRVRFKRRTSERRRDSLLPAGVDPYRTQYGISEGALGAYVALSVILLMGLVILVGFLVENANLF